MLVLFFREYPATQFPSRLVQVAEQFLRGEITLEEINESYNPRSIVSGGFFYDDAPPELNYTLDATVMALAEAIGVKLYRAYFPNDVWQIIERDIELGFPDEMMIAWYVDTASVAVCAYSGISFDWDTLDKMGLNGNDNAAEIVAHVNKTFHPDFNPSKRKEFWDWWLGEAISTAWNLAFS